jgi:XTP/dITP diphosphohydrolase
MRDLCFATNNKHKLEEVKLAIGSQFNLISLQDINCKEELPETRDTLEGNSLQKAEYVFQHYHVPCFADDTGLEVESLQGAPGVFSARYAGDHKNNQDNILLLLKKLAGHINRRARFRTIITLIGLEESPRYFEGIIHGTIIENQRGHQGFGYDPVFVPEGFNRTFAEMTLAEKNQLSHRALAVKKLSEYLKNYKP